LNLSHLVPTATIWSRPDAGHSRPLAPRDWPSLQLNCTSVIHFGP